MYPHLKTSIDKWDGFVPYFKTRGAIILLLLACGLISIGGCAAPPAKAVTIKYHYTETPDGLTLALCRYKPETLDQNKDPVILCHGLGYNMLFWDLHKDVSLPRYLARNGYDVWSLSLRGAGPSTQQMTSWLRGLTHFQLDPKTSMTLKNRLQGLKLLDWSVDDHIKYDVPSAINFVKENTTHKQVHWIGHSMGGMVMFGYLGTQKQEAARQIKSFVAATVPMTVFHPLNDPFRLLLDAKVAVEVGSAVLGSSAPAGLGSIFGDLDTPTDRLFFNGENVEKETLQLLFQRAQENISPGQLKQLLTMVRTERFQSLKGDLDYTQLLETVTTPTLFLAGAVDNMASPDAVRFAYRQVVSTTKEFHMFGRVNGHQNNYGHDDVIIGENAATEVYPVILDWLNKRSQSPQEQTPMPLQPKPLSTL